VTEDDWTRITPWLDKSLECGGKTHTVEDVRKMHAEAKCQVWLGENCAIVTEFNWTRMPSLHIWLVAAEPNTGGLAEALEIYRHGLLPMAKGMNLKRITGTGRKGWGPTMKDDDWEPVMTIFAKELT